jgi:hypothetical protein
LDIERESIKRVALLVTMDEGLKGDYSNVAGGAFSADDIHRGRV